MRSYSGKTYQDCSLLHVQDAAVGTAVGLHILLEEVLVVLVQLTHTDSDALTHGHCIVTLHVA